MHMGLKIIHDILILLRKLAAIGDDSEDVYIEPERMDCGIPSIMTVDTTQTVQDTSVDTEGQATMQALRDRQQMAFEFVTECFNALLVKYLLAQRSLTTIHNQ